MVSGAYKNTVREESDEEEASDSESQSNSRSQSQDRSYSSRKRLRRDESEEDHSVAKQSSKLAEKEE